MKKDYGCSKGDLKRGYKPMNEEKEMYPMEPKDGEMDERPLNSTFRDWDDGGFLGRSKGGER